LLLRLVGVCLVEGSAIDEVGRERRYRVVRTLRPLIAERRRAADAPQAQRRLLEWALALAEEASPHLGSGDAEVMLERLACEQLSLRAALEIGHRLELNDRCVRLTVLLIPFWIRRGQRREGVEWAERAERLPSVERGLRASLLIGLGRLLRSAEPARAESLVREALALAVQGDDRANRIEALNELATLARDRGDFTSTESLLREQIAQLAEHDDPRRRFRVETELATLLLQDSRHAEAVEALRERLSEAEARDWRFDRARLSNNLAVGLIELGQHAEALRLATEGAALFRQLGSLEGVAHLLSTAGMALMRRGEAMQARRHFVEVGRIALEVGAAQLWPEVLERIAALEIEGGRERVGARYLYAADALYAAAGCERERADRALRDALQGRLDAKLDAVTLGGIRVDAMMQARSVLTEAINASS
jgi:tetratricopeptide (TPR) repeat protein